VNTAHSYWSESSRSFPNDQQPVAVFNFSYLLEGAKDPETEEHVLSRRTPSLVPKLAHVTKEHGSQATVPELRILSATGLFQDSDGYDISEFDVA
jgi:hypothetical protein